MGMRVIAVDGGDAKGEMCKKLGAEHYIDFKNVQDIAAEVLKITTVTSADFERIKRRG